MCSSCTPHRFSAATPSQPKCSFLRNAAGAMSHPNDTISTVAPKHEKARNKGERKTESTSPPDGQAPSPPPIKTPDAAGSDIRNLGTEHNAKFDSGQKCDAKLEPRTHLSSLLGGGKWNCFRVTVADTDSLVASRLSDADMLELPVTVDLDRMRIDVN
eukprot:6193477-Pleurochrysis_carterae.AAC.1